LLRTTAATPHLAAGGFAYLFDDAWAKIPDGYQFPEVAGVATDEDDKVYVFNRDPHPIVWHAP
jgi:hypothetical protein